jgi:hypothetical protein
MVTADRGVIKLAAIPTKFIAAFIATSTLNNYYI